MSIMSKAVKNVRWFQKLLGTTDISGIGNGTVTNAVSTLNDAIATGALDRLDPSRLSVTENLKYTSRGSGFRLVAWNPNTINIPEANTWGVCACFDYYLASGNKWYNNLAFCTDGRIFVAHKRNDETWSDWTKITTTTTL